METQLLSHQRLTYEVNLMYVYCKEWIRMAIRLYHLLTKQCAV